MSSSIKKICVCAPQIPFVHGGAEMSVANLVSQLRQRGYQAEEVRVPLQPMPLEEVVKSCLAWRLMNLDQIYNDQINLVIGMKFPSYMIPHPRKIIWLIQQFRQIYDFYGTRYSEVGDSSKDVQLRNAIIELDQIAFGEAQKIFTISKTVSQRLKQHNGFDSTPVYPPVADSERFHFESLDDFVLSVSRLEGNKRIDLLLKAMPSLPSSIKAVIVGDGFLRAQYEEIAEELGMTDRIRFTGEISRAEVIEYFSRAGVVFYGPVDEDYGYVTLESFYSRKPVITCRDSGGTLEFVTPSNGWIADPEPESIASCIREAFARKEESRAKGESGYKDIAFINWEYVFDHLLSFQ